MVILLECIENECDRGRQSSNYCFLVMREGARKRGVGMTTLGRSILPRYSNISRVHHLEIEIAKLEHFSVWKEFSGISVTLGDLTMILNYFLELDIVALPNGQHI